MHSSFNSKFMKHIILSFLLLLSFSGWATTDTVKAKSTITGVNVFYNGAQIVRKVDFKAGKGDHLLVIENLTADLDPQSIQVGKFEGGKILSVKHELQYPSPSYRSKEEKELEASIDAQEMKIKEMKNKIQVYDLEEKLLLDNSTLAGKDKGVSITEIKDAADFYRARLNEVRQSKLSIQYQLEDATDQLKKLYENLNKVLIKKNKVYSRLLISMECSKEIAQGNIEVTYYVATAGWIPSYDFRVEGTNKPLVITYNASVYQSTGEDWNNVKIKLSTNDPTLSGDKPELKPWILGQYNPIQQRTVQFGSGALAGRVIDANTKEMIPFAAIQISQNGERISATTSDLDGLYNVKPIRTGYYDIEVSYVGYNNFKMNGVYIAPDKTTTNDIYLSVSAVELSEVVVSSRAELGFVPGVMRQDVKLEKRKLDKLQEKGNADNLYSDMEITNYISNSLKTNLNNLEYEIDVPYSVPSDGKDYQIRIKDASMPVKYVYHVVPKLDSDVFLNAEIIGWNELNLLSGKINIYYQGTFTGDSYLDVEKTGDTLNVSLGRDQNIIVKREGNKLLSDKQILSNNIKETVAWDITVRNNKSDAITLIVEDQFPISEKKSIEINQLETSKGKVDEKTGKIEWNLLLNPGEKKTITYKYSVKYPKEANPMMD